jgi:hypothetical protein
MSSDVRRKRLFAGTSEVLADGLPKAKLGITLARRNGQVIRMEAHHESSHQFSRGGFGGGRNSHGTWRVFAGYDTADQEGDQSSG